MTKFLDASSILTYWCCVEKRECDEQIVCALRSIDWAAFAFVKKLYVHRKKSEKIHSIYPFSSILCDEINQMEKRKNRMLWHWMIRHKFTPFSPFTLFHSQYMYYSLRIKKNAFLIGRMWDKYFDAIQTASISFHVSDWMELDQTYEDTLFCVTMIHLWRAEK